MPSKLFKVSTKNMPFLNRNRICTIYKRAELNNDSYLYWVEEDGKKINGRFLRQELFAINNQFEKNCKESILNDDIKFVLGFSDEEFVHQVNFLNNLDYYITSLNCNLILKDIVKDHKDNKERKKLTEDLSQKSRLLLEKGAAYQNRIGWMTSAIAGYFNFSGFGVTYNFILYPKTIDENSYKYKFYDTVEKKIRDCKIYSPFSHYKGNGFEFKRNNRT